MAGSRRGGLILQPRDRHLLERLEVLRVVDREQAKLFAPFHSTTRANTRLLALTRSGYLKRAFVGTIAAGRKAVYYLPGRRLYRKTPLAAERAIAHQLELNRLYHTFQTTLPEGAELIEWRRFDHVLSPRFPLIPDAYVRLRSPEGERAFFLELDLGTEPLRVWEGKVAAYLDLALSGEFEPMFGIRSFGVIVVASSANRLAGIRGVMAKQTERVFWLSTLSTVHEQGLRGRIWYRPASGSVVGLACE